MKRVTLFVIAVFIFALPVLAQEVKLEEKYDRFADETILTTGQYPGMPMTELKNPKSWTNVWFWAGIVFPGRELKSAPSTINITLIGRNGTWPDYETPTFRLIVDGERISLGSMRYVSSTIYAMEITPSTFARIAAGKSVEGELFGTEFKFTDEQLDILREFSKRMNPK